MKFDKINEHLYILWFEGDECDELTKIIEHCKDTDALYRFFKEHEEHLNNYHNLTISAAISQVLAELTEIVEKLIDINTNQDVEDMFEPLSRNENPNAGLLRSKTYKGKPKRNVKKGLLRIYAIRVDQGIYIITGGAIKIYETMQDAPNTQHELDKLNRLQKYFKDNGITDECQFTIMINSQEFD